MTEQLAIPKLVPFKVERHHGDRIVHIHCPYCFGRHSHGWPSEAGDAAPGHRVSHCGGNDGYYICAPTRTVTIS